MLLKEKHIVIIEDNITNAAIMLTTLQNHGAITHFDRWGDQAIARLLDLPQIDLILMDLMLPAGRTGYEIFEFIKATPQLATVPVVVVSASDPSVEMPKARARGFAGYISKPIHYASFAQLIVRIIEGEAVWADELDY